MVRTPSSREVLAHVSNSASHKAGKHHRFGNSPALEKRVCVFDLQHGPHQEMTGDPRLSFGYVGAPTVTASQIDRNARAGQLATYNRVSCILALFDRTMRWKAN